MTSARPQRERVVLAHRRGARIVRTRVEVQEQTEVGDALVRGLVRAQLGLAMRLAAVVVCVIVAVPLEWSPVPGAVATSVFGIRLNWLVLAVLIVPAAVRRRPAVRAARRAGRARLRPRGRRGPVTDYPSIALTAAALLAAAVATVARRHLRRAAARAPPRTSWSPLAASARAGTPPRSPANTSRRHHFSALPAWSPSTVPTRCGTRSASPPATSDCCSSSRRRCDGPARTRCPTSPSSGSARPRLRTVDDAVRRRHLRALPRAAVPGCRPDAEHPSGTALLDRARGRRRDRHRQRGRRRDAVHHVRSGLPVLVETHRDRDPGPGAVGVVPRRPAPRSAVRCPPTVDAADHGRHRNRRRRPGRRAGGHHRQRHSRRPVGARRDRSPRPASTRSARAPR